MRYSIRLTHHIDGRRARSTVLRTDTDSGSEDVVRLHLYEALRALLNEYPHALDYPYEIVLRPTYAALAWVELSDSANFEPCSFSRAARVAPGDLTTKWQLIELHVVPTE